MDELQNSAARGGEGTAVLLTTNRMKGEATDEPHTAAARRGAVPYPLQNPAAEGSPEVPMPRMQRNFTVHTDIPPARSRRPDPLRIGFSLLRRLIPEPFPQQASPAPAFL